MGVVSYKLSARAALAASGALPENVNYAVKFQVLLRFHPFLLSAVSISACSIVVRFRNPHASACFW